MSDHQIRLLADAAMIRHFEAGEILFRTGEAANRFYLIEQGEVTLEANPGERPAVTIETVRDGGLLGWSWLFPPYVWHFDARAIKPTDAIFFYGTVLREYCEKDALLGVELFKRMSEVMVKRLQAARGKLIAALSEPAA